MLSDTLDNPNNESGAWHPKFQIYFQIVGYTATLIANLLLLAYRIAEI